MKIVMYYFAKMGYFAKSSIYKLFAFFVREE